MGHYCGECDERLVGGIEPTCCEEAESYCQECWDMLCEPNIWPCISKALKSDILDGGKIKPHTEQMIIEWANKENKCKYCEKALTNEMCRNNFPRHESECYNCGKIVTGCDNYGNVLDVCEYCR